MVGLRKVWNLLERKSKFQCCRHRHTCYFLNLLFHNLSTHQNLNQLGNLLHKGCYNNDWFHISNFLLCFLLVFLCMPNFCQCVQFWLYKCRVVFYYLHLSKILSAIFLLFLCLSVKINFTIMATFEIALFTRYYLVIAKLRSAERWVPQHILAHGVPLQVPSGFDRAGRTVNSMFHRLS